MSSPQITPFYGQGRQVQGASESRTMRVMPKSKQPKYTWWPWRAIAMAVPACAVGAGAAVAAYETFDKQDERMRMAVLTAMTIYGAGNGFLLGAAIGDFGRSILAMLAGAMAALIFSPLYAGPGILLAAPAVVCAMTGTLALHWTMQGVMDAVITGIGALFYGILAGAGAGLVIWIACGISMAALSAVFGKDAVPAIEVVAGLGVALTLGTGNMVFIGRIFRASYRAQA